MVQPVALPIRSASWREIASAPPPAGNGTIMRIGRAGHACANAGLAKAGLRGMEVGSLVSPRALPQMADCAQVVAQALTIPGLRVVALVPNFKYAQLAFAGGVHLTTIPVPGSEPHSISNIRKNH